ncbi:isocitrate lyase/PEP mutase family protein [Streptomyces sp. NPDC014685]|uniref:isocitrate lyase/PEP mutase family protein n=1 Tax=Streptomyces sp. NPDC014685 TaxID=3364881 RepID=UPI0036F92E8C
MSENSAISSSSEQRGDPPRPERTIEVWAGVYDALGALQAESLRYDALWLSSLGLSVGRLGLPDSGFLKPETILAAVSELRQVTKSPLVVDFENGYGLRTVELAGLAGLFYEAGADSLCMEDSAGEKRNSLWVSPDRQLSDADDMCERLTTLVDTAQRHGGSVVARTEALIVGGSVEETVERVRRYARTGCSAVVVHFRDDVGQALEVAAHKDEFLGTRLVIIPTKAPSMRFEEFADAGFDVYVAANIALRAAASAMREELRSVLTTRNQGDAAERISSLAELDALVGRDILVTGVEK